MLNSRFMSFIRTDAMRSTMLYYWLFICLGLSIGLVGPTLPSLANQTQTLVGDLGAVFTASAVGALLGTLLGDRLFDRVRGHRALGIAQLASAALIALYPVIPSAWILLVVVVGKGLTDGFINTGANTLLVWTHKEKSSPYMNAQRASHCLQIQPPTALTIAASASTTSAPELRALIATAVGVSTNRTRPRLHSRLTTPSTH
jgi:MFS family permease